MHRSPAVALMPDLTPNRLRSRANAVINLLGAVGGVYSLIMIIAPEVKKSMLFMLAFCTMLQVKHGDVKPPKKGLLESFDVED